MPIFDGFTDDEVDRIKNAGTFLTLPADWSPIWEKTPADKAYILLSGEVSVRRGGEEIARLGPGDIVGEVAIVKHSLRTASIVSLTKLEVLHFTSDAVRELCDEVPAFREALDRHGARAHRGPTARASERRARRSIRSRTSTGRCSAPIPAYTRREVAERAGVPLEVAEELWQQLGFPRTGDDDVAFTDADVEALRRTDELISLGILTEDSQAALVRTWGRSFARLAEWQVSLLAGMALEGDDPRQRLDELMDQVLPNVEELQSYIWRRHLASAANRMLGEARPDGVGTTSTMAVEFVDIVGYTSQSKNLTDAELVEWVEYFEDEMTRTRRRARRPGDQDDRRRDAVRGRRPARRRRDRAHWPPSAAPTRTTSSRRCAPASRTARWSAASATCTARR